MIDFIPDKVTSTYLKPRSVGVSLGSNLSVTSFQTHPNIVPDAAALPTAW